MEPLSVIEYYESTDEPGRLSRGRGRLEFVRVQELVRRFAPPTPAHVLDVGGAGGVHAAWLADDGHRVTLVDPVPRHVDAARALAAESEHGFLVQAGDARDLPVAAGAFDMVLLFGPLYHLPAREDRLATWREAARVTRPGGVILGMAIGRWAGTLDMSFRPPAEATPGFVPIAHFHGPTDLTEEVTAVGLRSEGTYGVEGPGWLVRDFDDRWEDEAERADLIDLARRTEQVPELMGLHAHLIEVARR